MKTNYISPKVQIENIRLESSIASLSNGSETNNEVGNGKSAGQLSKDRDEQKDDSWGGLW